MLLTSHCCTTNDQKRKLFTLRFKKYGNVILAIVYINKKGYTIRESQIYIKFKICKRYFIYKIIRLVNLKFENVFFSGQFWPNLSTEKKELTNCKQVYRTCWGEFLTNRNWVCKQINGTYPEIVQKCFKIRRAKHKLKNSLDTKTKSLPFENSIVWVVRSIRTSGSVDKFLP